MRDYVKPGYDLERCTRGAALYTELRDAFAFRAALEHYMRSTAIDVSPTVWGSRVVYALPNSERPEPNSPDEALHRAWEHAAMSFVLTHSHEIQQKALESADERIRVARVKLASFEAEVVEKKNG